MSLGTATVSFDVEDILGVDLKASRAVLRVRTNVPSQTLVDTIGNKVRVGGAEVPMPEAGMGSITVWVPGTGSNPASWQTYFDLIYRDPSLGGKQGTRTFGPFTITASTDLADLIEEQEVPPVYLSTVTQQLDTKVTQAQTARTGAEAARDQAQALVLSDLGTTDGQTRALIQNPASQTASALSASYVGLGTPGSGVTGMYKNDGTSRPAYTIGNAPGSAGFPGTGTPNRALGALAIYQKFGNDAGDGTVPIQHTTQAAYLLANYYAPTADDSMEAWSTYVGVKAVSAPFTQAKPVTSSESIAQVEGGNTVAGAGSYVMSVGARTNVLGTAHVENAYGFRATVNSSGGPTFGVIDRYVAFFQPVKATNNGGTVTSAFGVYVADPINSESAITLGKSGWTGQLAANLDGNADAAKSMLVIKSPDAASGDATPRGLTPLSVVAGANQTRSLFEARDSGGTTRLQIGAAGNLFMRGQSIIVADSSGNAKITQAATALTFADAVDVVLGTTTGTKIGTGTTQKLGFFGQTPTVRPTLPNSSTVTAADVRQALITLGLAA